MSQCVSGNFTGILGIFEYFSCFKTFFQNFMELFSHLKSFGKKRNHILSFRAEPEGPTRFGPPKPPARSSPAAGPARPISQAVPAMAIATILGVRARPGAPSSPL
jgi:hypothetical protein